MNEIPLHFSDPHKAFSVALGQHPQVDRFEWETPEKQFEISRDYFVAGFNYLVTSCSSKKLKEQARIVTKAFQYSMISFGYATSTYEAAKQYNMTLVSTHPTMLNVAFPGEVRNGLDAHIYITPQFVTQARTNPLDALAHIAFATSCLRDFAFHRRWVDWQNFLPRAQAAASEVIVDFLPGDEYWRLSTDTIDMIDAFPNGFQSLDPSMTYTKPSGLPLYGDLI